MIERAGSMPKKVAIFATIGNRDRSDYSDRHGVAANATFCRMANPNIIEWVQLVLAKTGWGQADLAREINKLLPEEIDRSKVNKIVLGKRDLSAVEMLAIEEASGIPAPTKAAAAGVPLISWVSAGKLSVPDTPLDPDELQKMIWASDLDGKGDWIALKVVGDSMDKISPPDSIILVNRADKRLVSNACYVIVTEEGGEATYKRYRDGRWGPASMNKRHKLLPKGRDPRVIGRVRKSILSM